MSKQRKLARRALRAREAVVDARKREEAQFQEEFLQRKALEEIMSLN